MKLTPDKLLIAFVISIVTGCGSSPASKGDVPRLSVKSMRDDLFVLWSAIREMHPGYGIYTPADSLQKAYDRTCAEIVTPLTERDFITLLYPFLCKLRCGHTQIRHSAGYEVTGSQPHLPFEVLVQHHRAWVTTHQKIGLNTGDELLSINNEPVATIIDHGYDSYCDDGYNETFKELYLSEYDGFEDVCNNYYHWAYPYRVKYRTSSGEVKSMAVDSAKRDTPADSSVKKVDNYANWTTAESIPDARLRFLKNAPVAFFQSTPFAYNDTLVFRDAFELIREKGIKSLILDMRHNTGGDLRVAIQLLAYLADSSFQIVKDVESRLPDPAVNSFALYFDSSSTKGFTLGFRSTYKEGAWYHIESRPAFGNLYGPFPLDKRAHFSGRVLVLIDGATFSSGALFSAAIKAQRKGVLFVGRETAGSEEGCNGVTLQKLTLPNTKIVVDFPWMRVTSMAKHAIPGRGVMPDYPVTYSPDDILTQNDPDLKKALSIVTGSY